MERPKSRCAYSTQKIDLNSERLMPVLTFWYSGVCLYLSKVASHCGALSGGIAPMMGSHSTIERPERVRRVTPPRTTLMKTSAQQAKNHRTMRRLSWGE